jgi:predicted Zn-dependent protease
MNAFDYDMISRYVDGEMTAEELKDFEQQLQQNSELKKEVELYKEVNDVLKQKLHPAADEMALRETLEEMRNEYFKPKAKIISFKKVTMWVVSAAAVLLLFVFIWSPWKQDLYKQFASIEMAPVAERGNAADSLLKKATVDFNDKKFNEAIPSFETILKNDTANSYVHYYYAIALLQNDQVNKSRYELIQLYNGNSLFKYDAAFYMALSYVKVKDNVKAKEWLDKIPAGTDVYDKAQKLEKKF